ncbi:porin family protein [Flavobacterium faecale]|uniref:porin family protein n=1 Tax=Flavobacterium faecale TaxID=1355330 RepID=UPI003AAB8043
MKKIIVAFVFVFVSAVVQGQEVRFGLKGGTNVSLFGNKVDPKLGFQLGLFSKIKLADQWYVQPEALYLEQSVKRDNFSVGLFTFDRATMKLSSIYVPVVFRYYPLNDLFLESGPQVGFLVKTKATAEYQGNSGEIDVDDEFKKVDFGFNFGTGYDISERFSLNIRYYVGLTKMSDSDYVRDFYNRNSILSLSGAFTF